MTLFRPQADAWQQISAIYNCSHLQYIYGSTYLIPKMQEFLFFQNVTENHGQLIKSPLKTHLRTNVLYMFMYVYLCQKLKSNML